MIAGMGDVKLPVDEGNISLISRGGYLQGAADRRRPAPPPQKSEIKFTEKEAE